MSEINISLNTDAATLTKAQIKLDELGIDIKTILKDLIIKLANNELSEEDIKLLIKSNNTGHNRSDLCGMFKGQIWMADNFDDELDDFDDEEEDFKL